MATCFVIMPISMPVIYAQRYNDEEHFQHVFDHLMIPALALANYEALAPAVAGSDLIQAEIIKNLEQCDLVLCDISTLNPNVFFELGIRTSLDRPAVLIRDNFTTEIPFDTGSINTYTYDSSLQPWKLESQVAGLAKHITESAKRSGDRNSLWRYFGLTQRATPAEISNPAEAKLDLVISEVTRLAKQVDSYVRPPTDEGKTPAPPDSSARTPALSDVPRFFSSPGVDAPSVISKVGTAATNIPAKYQDFVLQVENIIITVGGRLAYKGYDETQDVVVLRMANYLNKFVVSDIDKAAQDSSIKYVLETKFLD